jgi:DNA repair ATPase RecN
MSTEQNKGTDLVSMYRLHSWKPEITLTPVVHQTACFVTYIDDWCGKKHERRERKEGQFFDTWEAAHNALTERLRRQVQSARSALDRAEYQLSQAAKMVMP